MEGVRRGRRGPHIVIRREDECDGSHTVHDVNPSQGAGYNLPIIRKSGGVSGCRYSLCLFSLTVTYRVGILAVVDYVNLDI